MTMQYAVVIEKSSNGYGAYVPDLPGCVAVGETEAEVRQLIGAAIELHVEAMREDGIPIPPPTSSVTYVEVAQAA
jgi:predicted RNase H-like HicB family nuclease